MTIRKQRLTLLLAGILVLGMPVFAQNQEVAPVLMGAMGMNPDSIPISREECIDIALSQSPTIRIADLEVKRVDYSKRETIGNLLPQIGFSLSYQRSIELQTMYEHGGTEPETQNGFGQHMEHRIQFPAPDHRTHPLEGYLNLRYPDSSKP